MNKFILLALSLIIGSISVHSSPTKKCLLYMDGFEEFLDRDQIKLLKQKYDLTTDETAPYEKRVAFENFTRDFNRSYADCMSQESQDSTTIGCTSEIFIVDKNDETMAKGVGKINDNSEVISSIPFVDAIWNNTLAKRALSKAIESLDSCK